MNICHLELKPYFLYDQMNKSKCTIVTKIYIMPDNLGEPIIYYTIPINESVDTSMDTVSIIGQVHVNIIPIINQIDGYKVICKKTNKFLGHLLVNTGKDSVYLRNFFKTKKTMQLVCTYNTEFNKWQRARVERS